MIQSSVHSTSLPVYSTCLLHLQPTNMFTALHTLTDTASSKNELSPLSPMSNIAEPGSPFSDMDISSSSDERTLPSLLFKIDLEDKEKEDQLTGDPILPNINDLFDITPHPNQGLWDKNRTKAMDQLTNKAIMEFSKMTRTDPNSFALTMTHESEKQMLEPYEDWMPSPHTWNDGVPCLPTPLSDMTTLDDKEAQTSIANSWPSPPSPPLKGTDMQPPIKEFSGTHPGHPWEYNTIGSPNYFHLLIPDPAMPRCQIVALYIKYNSDTSYPKISSTFGQDYPIITCALRPTQVNYLCPVLTPSQTQVLAPDKKFSKVIDWILGEHCPCDLHAGVGQYQHYLNACQTVQKQINTLQGHYMYYLEKCMEVLSNLKNTNILGCILAHTEEFDRHPKAYASFFQAVSPFCGHITYSGTNVAIDHYMSGAIALGLPAVSKPPPPYVHLTYANALCNSKSICKPLTTINKLPSIPTRPRSTHGKCCHKCCVLRHIRHECPKRQGKKKVFFI